MAILKKTDDLPDEIATLTCDGYIIKLDGIYKIVYDEASGTTKNILITATPCLPIASLRDAERGGYGDEDDRTVTYMMMAIVPTADGYRTMRFRATAETLADPHKAVSLSKFGISITSAEYKSTKMVAMWQSILDQNRGTMPEILTNSHLGWIDGGLFAGIDDGITPDGDGTLRDMMKAMIPQGDIENWKLAAKDSIGNIEVRLMLDASMASPLLQRLKIDPFIVHACGKTGTGKTVAEMLAMSIWADPDKSSVFMQTMDSTIYSCETLADKLKCLPMVCDEGQLVSAGKSKKDFVSMIYKLTEGKSKNRGQKDGGLRKQLTWRLIILSSGEHPLTNDDAPDGAKNRIINAVFPGTEERLNGSIVSDICRENYGWAGRECVQYLQDADNFKNIKTMYKEYKEELGTGATGKQAVNGAVLLTGDYILSKILDVDPLTLEDIRPFLIEKKSLDEYQDLYEILVSMIQSEKGAFYTDDINENDILRRRHTPIYGMIDKKDDRTIAYIHKSKFKDYFCSKLGIDDRMGFLRWLKNNEKLVADHGPYDSRKVMYGDKQQSTCTAVVLSENDDDNFYEIEDDDDCEF